jgi:hypothetical protein
MSAVGQGANQRSADEMAGMATKRGTNRGDDVGGRPSNPLDHPLRSKLNWPFPINWRNPVPVKPLTKKQRLDEMDEARW